MSGPTQQFGVPDFDGIRRGDNNSLADAMILMWRVLTVNNPQLVTLQNTQTLSNKTLVTPTVSDLTNMTHDHADAAGGGNTLTVPTIADLTNMTHDHSSAAEGGAIAAGSVDHGGLGGLSDDDHTQYLLADGTRALSAAWDAGSFKITAETLGSDVATGTAPLTVASTTVVSNLNADLLDGEEASAFADASHAHAASDITSGTLADARISESSVTQHQGAIDHGSIAGLNDDDHSQYYLADATRKMALMFMGELSADPSDPAEGEAVMWMSDGTGSGSDGDILMKITAGAATSTVELVVAPA